MERVVLRVVVLGWEGLARGCGVVFVDGLIWLLCVGGGGRCVSSFLECRSCWIRSGYDFDAHKGILRLL